jgi:hypothetical protein
MMGLQPSEQFAELVCCIAAGQQCYFLLVVLPAQGWASWANAVLCLLL